MLDWKIEKSDGWTDIRSDYGQCLSFQQAPVLPRPVLEG